MLKKYFSAGLLVWLPLACTLWLLETLIRWSDAIVMALPESWRPESLIGWTVPGIGLVLTALVVFVTGVLVANIVGAKIIQLWEAFLNRIPFIRPVYSGVKQIAQTILSDQTTSFKEVVLIEFPREGCWTLAFVVSKPPEDVRETLGRDVVTVYVPTSPNPTSGYVLMVPRSSLRPTEVSVDEAFKFHISLGVVAPSEHKKTQESHPEHGTTPESGAKL